MHFVNSKRGHNHESTLNSPLLKRRCSFTPSRLSDVVMTSVRRDCRRMIQYACLVRHGTMALVFCIPQYRLDHTVLQTMLVMDVERSCCVSAALNPITQSTIHRGHTTRRYLQEIQEMDKLPTGLAAKGGTQKESRGQSGRGRSRTLGTHHCQFKED